VLSRLFNASYDLSQFNDAQHWCEEGQRRFPDDYKFVACQLWMLTTKAKDPDVALAWKLADSLPKISPGPRQQFEKLEGMMNVAAVLARAGLKDSARKVALRARGNADVDPTKDLAWDETYVRILVGDKDEAFKLLTAYLAANPERRAGLADNPSWWLREIQNDPRFEALARPK
jgi:serine/threonine-protein kinase